MESIWFSILPMEETPVQLIAPLELWVAIEFSTNLKSMKFQIRKFVSRQEILLVGQVYL